MHSTVQWLVDGLDHILLQGSDVVRSELICICVCEIDRFSIKLAAVTRRHFKMAKLSIQRSKFDEAMQKVEKNNSLIQTFVSRSSKLQPLRTRLQRDAKSAVLHKEASNLYYALEPRWVSNCSSSHFASLCIDPRFAFPNEDVQLFSAQYVEEVEPLLGFNVVFKLAPPRGESDSLYQETNIKLLPNRKK